MHNINSPRPGTRQAIDSALLAYLPLPLFLGHVSVKVCFFVFPLGHFHLKLRIRDLVILDATALFY